MSWTTRFPAGSDACRDHTGRRATSGAWRDQPRFGAIRVAGELRSRRTYRHRQVITPPHMAQYLACRRHDVRHYVRDMGEDVEDVGTRENQVKRDSDAIVSFLFTRRGCDAAFRPDHLG